MRGDRGRWNSGFRAKLLARRGLNEKEPTMAPFWPIVLVAAGTLMTASPALAQVPDLDIGPTCRAAAGGSFAKDPKAACERDENRARETLGKLWAGFPADERRRCTSLTKMGGSPSYVELLTCLQAAEEAAKLPKKGLEGPVK